MMSRLKIIDTVFDPDDKGQRSVRYHKDSSGRPMYKVWLYLEGPELFYVEHVTYQLHSSFQDSVRNVFRTASNKNCKLEIWTWGVFTVRATIFLKTGENVQLSHYLSYDHQLKQGDIKFFDSGSFS